jgi:ribose transport system permease protein
MSQEKEIVKNRKKTVISILQRYSYVIVFFTLFLLYYYLNTNLTWTGVTNIFRHSGVIGVLSLGVGLVIVTANFDLSIGSILAFSASIGIVIFNITDNIILLFITSVLVGGLCGLLNGFLVGKAKMPAFIVTLATMLILRSIVQYYCHVLPNFFTGGGNNLYKLASTPAKNALFSFGNSKILSLPMVGIALAIVTILIVYVTTSTKFGKKLYAVGSNAKAARLSGVNTESVIVGVFTLSGLFAGFAAFLWVAMQGSVDPSTTGKGNEMYAIAAVVLGGLSMSGGKGKFLGIFFGALSYTVIDKIIASVKVDSLINDAIKGTILLVAILAQSTGPGFNVRKRKFLKPGGPREIATAK